MAGPRAQAFIRVCGWSALGFPGYVWIGQTTKSGVLVASYIKGTQGKALGSGAESFHKGHIRGSYIRNLYLLCGM